MGWRKRQEVEGQEGKSDSCLPSAELSWGLKKDGDPQKPESKWKQGGFHPTSCLGFAQTSWPISPHQQGAVCHIRAETTLKSKGMQKRGAGSLKFPQAGWQAPQPRLRP